MNKIFVIIVLLSQTIYAQQEEEEDSSYYLGFKTMAGAVLAPSADFGVYSVQLQWRNVKMRGFGLDVSFTSFESPNLDTNPNPDLIANYDEGLSAPWEQIVNIGSENDDAVLFSPYYSHGFALNSNIFLEFQGGATLGLYRERQYSYSYAPEQGPSCGVGAFFCNRPGPFLQITNTNNSFDFTYGGYLRTGFQFKAGTDTLLELGGVSYITADEVIVGFQLGFVFGFDYKRKTYKQ